VTIIGSRKDYSLCKDRFESLEVKECLMDLQATTSVKTDIVGQIRAPELLTRANGDLERLATKLRRALRSFDAAQTNPSAFGRPLKVAVISSFLTDYLVDMLSLMLVRRGYHPTISAAGYGQLVTDYLASPMWFSFCRATVIYAQRLPAA
jgi:hypothetical protein